MNFAFEMDETLQITLLQAYLDDDILSCVFAGEITIKGTNLYRNEYGEDSVELSGYFSRTSNRMHLFEGFVHRELEKGTPYEYDISDNKSFCTYYNKNATSFDEFVKYFAIVIAHHEGYMI